MLKLTCKQGSLQLTDDDYLQVHVPLKQDPLWREPIATISEIAVKRTLIAYSLAIHASQIHQVDMLTKGSLTNLRAALPSVTFTEVTTLPTQPAPVPTGPQIETTVKTYPNSLLYQSDLRKMTADGWTVLSVMDQHKNRSVAYKLIVPLGILSGGTNKIIVTYQRQKR